jgi:hypothetical protein
MTARYQRRSLFADGADLPLFTAPRSDPMMYDEFGPIASGSTTYPADPEPAECEYCGAYPCTDGVPALHDDEAWADLTREHEPDCEWIETRSHRLPDKIAEALAQEQAEQAAVREWDRQWALSGKPIA